MCYSKQHNKNTWPLNKMAFFSEIRKNRDGRDGASEGAAVTSSPRQYFLHYESRAALLLCPLSFCPPDCLSWAAPIPQVLNYDPLSAHIPNFYKFFPHKMPECLVFYAAIPNRSMLVISPPRRQPLFKGHLDGLNSILIFSTLLYQLAKNKWHPNK